MAVTGGPRAVVEDFYRRFNRGERIPEAFFHPEIDWHWPPDTLGPSVFHGREGIATGLSVWTESWGEFQMEPEELIGCVGPRAASTSSSGLRTWCACRTA
jgi:hypothetical protein